MAPVAILPDGFLPIAIRPALAHSSAARFDSYLSVVATEGAMSILQHVFEKSFYGVRFAHWLDENRSLFRPERPTNVYMANVGGNREAHLARFCKQTGIPFFLPFIYELNPERFELLWPGTIIVSLASEAKESAFKEQQGVRFIQKCSAASIEQMKKIGIFNRRARSGLILDEGPLRGKAVYIVKGPLTDATPRSIRITDQGRAEITLKLLGREVKAVLPAGALSIDLDLISLDEAVFGEARGTVALQSKILDVNSELVQYLRTHPEFMYELSSQKFEEVIGEILIDMGFEIQFTPRGGGDGGRDIIAAIPLPIGKLLTIVECKRYQALNKVGSDIVERFIYTIDRKDNASCGLIATTSFFTGEAKAIEEKFKWRLKLRDFDGIREWLSQYGSWAIDGKSGLFIPKGKLLPNTCPA